jgi:hypothetical protein
MMDVIFFAIDQFKSNEMGAFAVLVLTGDVS